MGRAETEERSLATEQYRPAIKAKRKTNKKDQAQKQRWRKRQHLEMAVREAYLAGGQTKRPGRQNIVTWGDRPRRPRDFISRCAARTSNGVVLVAV